MLELKGKDHRYIIMVERMDLEKLVCILVMVLNHLKQALDWEVL